MTNSEPQPELRAVVATLVDRLRGDGTVPGIPR